MSTRERIRQRLSEKELTVQGASLRAGLGQTTLRDYLSNEDRSVTERTLKKLAPVLGCTVDWLLTGKAGESDPELAEVVDIWDRIPRAHRKTILDLANGLAKKG